MATTAVRPFGVKASEAIANIQQKVAVPSERWNDFLGPVHAKAFTVAGATEVDLVRDLHNAVSKAVTAAINQIVAWTNNVQRTWNARAFEVQCNDWRQIGRVAKRYRAVAGRRQCQRVTSRVDVRDRRFCAGGRDKLVED